jgi:hypothetical protein
MLGFELLSPTYKLSLTHAWTRVHRINVRREKENGEPIAEFEEGIDWWIIGNVPEMSACLRFIDPYGNLLINQLQLPDG